MEQETIDACGNPAFLRDDPSIGRFFSVDPLAEEYPGWSPYVCALENPLGVIDPDGKLALGIQIRNESKSTLYIFEENWKRIGISKFEFTENAPRFSDISQADYGLNPKLPTGPYLLEPRERIGKIIGESYPVYTSPGKQTGNVVFSTANGEEQIRGESTNTGAIGPHLGTKSAGCPLLDPKDKEKSKQDREVLKSIVERNEDTGKTRLYLIDRSIIDNGEKEGEEN